MASAVQSFAFARALNCAGESTRSSRPCAFLAFQVEEIADATLVTIDAPPGGEPTLRQLADLFTPSG